ncbi:HNH endonuclease signature motif containing protein [Pseudofrankia asymbiotica]|uniref:HNH endonuclease signature motif containing protein n=1 Tax=Pseudofrankia asymbiotica TaxID=1834516 RepID=UPI002378300F|nr:HNH endonuclease signature motif containing protein [Pseudofrankia asymbiotica]
MGSGGEGDGLVGGRGAGGAGAVADDSEGLVGGGDEWLGQRHHALDVADGVVGGLEKLGGANLWALSDAEALELLDRAERSRRLLAALLLAVVRDLNDRDLRGVFGEEDLPSTADLLRWHLKTRPADARRTVTLARDLDGPYRRTGQALAAAEISHEQATVIAGALNSLPGDTPTEQRDWAESFLLDQARHLDAGDLAQLGKTIRGRLQDQLHPPGSDPTDDGDQARRRELHLTDQPDGTTRIHGTLDAEGAAALRAALEPLSRPKPLGENPEDHRTVAQLRADALIEITERVLGTGTLPLSRGTRPHVTVTTTVDELLSRDRAGLATSATPTTPATTGYGLPLSHAALERICCDADLTHLLLSREGMPLELGRTRRIVPPWLRRALAARDGGCAFPNCPKPAAWADAHHLVHWLSGGETNVGNTMLLCPYHHRVIHRDEWKVLMGVDGHPYFIPPYSVDTQQRPRRNPLHRTLNHLYTGIWDPTHAGGDGLPDEPVRQPTHDRGVKEAVSGWRASGVHDGPDSTLFVGPRRHSTLRQPGASAGPLPYENHEDREDALPTSEPASQPWLGWPEPPAN